MYHIILFISIQSYIFYIIILFYKINILQIKEKITIDIIPIEEVIPEIEEEN